MYLIREYYDIAPGAGREFEPRVSTMQGEMAKQPGFVSTYVLGYLGNTTRYIALRLWESREASQAWGGNPFLQHYLQTRPTGLYATPPAIEYYEPVAESHGGGRPSFVEVLAVDLAGGRAQEFLARERDLGEACRSLQGFVERRSFRFLGNTTKMLIVTAWTSAEACDAAAWDIRAEFYEERPLADLISGRQIQEHYRVVDRRYRRSDRVSG